MKKIIEKWDYESPEVSVVSSFVEDVILSDSNGTGGTTEQPIEQSDANIWNWWEL